jgi:hypothetical protein
VPFVGRSDGRKLALLMRKVLPNLIQNLIDLNISCIPIAVIFGYT